MGKAVASLVVPVFMLLLSVTCSGQTDETSEPMCTPSVLDFRALPPAVAAESPDWHLFVIEVQNIGKSTCTLSAWVDLLPKFDTNNNPTFGWDGSDGADSNQKYPPKQLSPGDWAHML